MKALKNQKGQSLVEYLIIVALVAVGSVGMMKLVGQQVTVQFAQIVKSLGGSVDGNLSNASVTSTSYQKKDLRNFMRGSLNKAGTGSSSGGGADSADND